jgi:hypothetical protein
MRHIQEALINEGFVITDLLFGPEVLENLLKELAGIGAFNYEQPQILNLLKACDNLKVIAYDETLLSLLKFTTGEDMFPVKAFILDKSTESNWEIPWHQDLKIAVNQKVVEPGYKNWSLESGILHVQPPVAVMEKLVTLRIHFDVCDVKNAIHIIPGSHKLGIFTPQQIENLVAHTSSHICLAVKNSVMLMKPLLLHYSPPSSSSSPRRILQIEYGYDLSHGLTWHDQTDPSAC